MMDPNWFDMRTDEERRTCPITQKLDCQDRDCELHYMDAPLNLAPEINGVPLCGHPENH